MDSLTQAALKLASASEELQAATEARMAAEARMQMAVKAQQTALAEYQRAKTATDEPPGPDQSSG